MKSSFWPKFFQQLFLVIVFLWGIATNAPLLYGNTSLIYHWIFFVLLFCIGFFLQLKGLGLMIATLPMHSGLIYSLNYAGWNGIPVVWPMGAEHILGFSLGLFCWDLKSTFSETSNQIASIKLKGLFICLLLSLMSSMQGIFWNLYSSGSSFSIKGFFYNVLGVRLLNPSDDYFPLILIYVFSLGVAALVCIQNVQRKLNLDKIKLVFSVLNYLIAAGVIYGNIGILQKIWNRGWAKSGIERGVNSVFPDLHSFAGFELMCQILCTWFFLHGSKGKRKFMYGFFTLNAAAAVWVSGSRFCTVLSIVALVGVVLMESLPKGIKSKIELNFKPIFFGGIFSIFCASAFFFRSMTFEKANLLLSYRPDLFLGALRIWWDEPFLGVGLGNFVRMSMLPDFSKSIYLVNSGGENAHNYFLQILAETGILGVSVFCYFLFTEKTNLPKKLFLFLILSQVGGNLFGHQLLISEFMWLFILIIGLVSFSDLEFSRPMLSIVFLSLLFGLFYNYQKRARYPYLFGYECKKERNFGNERFGGKILLVNNSFQNWVFSPEHPDLLTNPVAVTFKDLDSGKVQERILSQYGPFPAPFETNRLEVTVSRCYSPINHGVSFDKNRYGLKVEKKNL